jgi:hypothetical protein
LTSSFGGVGMTGAIISSSLAKGFPRTGYSPDLIALRIDPALNLQYFARSAHSLSKGPKQVKT